MELQNWFDKDINRQSLLSFIGESMLENLIILDQGKVLHVSPSMANVFGFGREEAAGKALSEWIHPDDRESFLHWTSEEAQGGPLIFQVRAVTGPDTLIYVEMQGISKRFQGSSFFLITSLTDISNHKRDEKAAHEIQEKFRTAFSYAAVGIALVGINGRFLDINYAFSEIVGFSLEELENATLQACIEPSHRVTYLEHCTQLLIGEITSYEVELRFCNKCGETVWGLLNATLVRDDEGKPLYYIVQLQNTTKRKEAEELLRKSDKLTAVGQLAAGVAHEVRNPLTVLKGFAQMLQKTEQANKAYYSLMLSEVERIESIIGEFLLLAKPQETKFQINELWSIIRQVIALMETKAVMNNVQFRYSEPEDRLELECDENQLKQVFINIMQNAIEAMPRGGYLTIRTDRPAPDRLYLSITDQGCGIPEERIARLGEPFYSSKEKGTGLGLMVSYQIIQKHQGMIHVSSKLNEGTTFEITLPINQNRNFDHS
jgi:two-component system sporulation sensor kinase A